MVAVVGGQAVSLAVGWLLYERTGNPWSLALVGLVQVVPVVAFFVAVGHVVDRYPRRRVLALAHVAHAATAFGLAAAAWLAWSTAAIYALLFLLGAARAFSAPAARAMLPQLVEPVQLPRVNALLAATFETASMVGPALGGYLIDLRGAPLVFLVGGACQIVFLGCLAAVRLRPTPPRSLEPEAQALLAGLRFVRKTPVLLAAVTLDLFGVLFGGAVALLPVFAKDVLEVGASGLGWLRAAPAAGAAATALLFTRLPPWRRPGKVLLLTVAGFGLATVGFGLSTSFPLSLACLFLVGAFDSVSVVIRLTLEQMVTPDALRGRVAAVNFVFIGLSNELGAFESGATAALVGPVLSVVGGGVISLLVVVLAARTWPELLRLGPLSTLRPARLPAPVTVAAP
jgi:MFS family permease